MRYCLHCAKELPDLGVTVCPHCGTESTSENTERLLAFAEFVMVACRHSIPAYKDQAPDENVRYFTPDLAEGAKWIALAVVSGVVGNAASDGVKALVNHFRKRLASRRQRSSLEDYLSDEPDVLMEQASAFFGAFPRLSRAAQLAVLEELYVHHMQRVIMKKQRAKEPLSEEDIRKAAQDAQVLAVDFLSNPPIDELRHLWGGFKDVKPNTRRDEVKDQAAE